MVNNFLRFQEVFFNNNNINIKLYINYFFNNLRSNYIIFFLQIFMLIISFMRNLSIIFQIFFISNINKIRLPN